MYLVPLHTQLWVMNKISNNFHQRAVTIIYFLVIFAGITLKLHGCHYGPLKVTSFSYEQHCETRLKYDLSSELKRNDFFSRKAYFSARHQQLSGRLRQRERLKSNEFRLAKQNLYACITLFCTFLCCRCMTTTWNFLISRFAEDMNTDKKIIFFFFSWTSMQSFRI